MAKRTLFKPELSFTNWKEQTLTQWSFVFWGRSNVGKSTLINALTERKNLAFTSKKPGKTQAIHFYEATPSAYYLVDLPGYGYAQLNQKQISRFTNLTVDFLTDLKIKKFVFVLIDSKIPWQKIDLTVLNQLKTWNVEFGIILNKVDQINQFKLQQKIQEAYAWTTTVFAFSFRNQTTIYLTAIRAFIQEWIKTDEH